MAARGLYQRENKRTWQEEFDALSVQLRDPQAIRESHSANVPYFTPTGATSIRVGIWRAPTDGYLLKNVHVVSLHGITANASTYWSFWPFVVDEDHGVRDVGETKTTQESGIGELRSFDWNDIDRVLRAGELVCVEIDWTGTPATAFGLMFTADVDRRGA